jgi:hypothetical protein
VQQTEFLPPGRSAVEGTATTATAQVAAQAAAPPTAVRVSGADASAGEFAPGP